jgi:hypothetical protein
MTDEAAFVTLVTLVVTTTGGVITQLLAMRKQERAAGPSWSRPRPTRNFWRHKPKAAAVWSKTKPIGWRTRARKHGKSCGSI